MELFSVEEDEEGEGTWGFEGKDAAEEVVGEVDYGGGGLRSEVD